MVRSTSGCSCTVGLASEARAVETSGLSEATAMFGAIAGLGSLVEVVELSEELEVDVGEYSNCGDMVGSLLGYSCHISWGRAKT
jgi:hypothetical protein